MSAAEHVQCPLNHVTKLPSECDSDVASSNGMSRWTDGASASVSLDIDAAAAAQNGKIAY